MFHTFKFKESTYHNYISYEYLGIHSEEDAECMSKKDDADEETFWFSTDKKIVIFTHSQTMAFKGNKFFNYMSQVKKAGWESLKTVEISKNTAEDFINVKPTGCDYVHLTKKLYGCLFKIK